MKKVLVILIVGVVLFGACSAQRAEAQSSNNAQKIIGTWVEQNGTTWVFNTNGNLTIGSKAIKFGVTETMLALSDDYYDYSISSDGKTLIIRMGGSSGVGWWLTKK